MQVSPLTRLVAALLVVGLVAACGSGTERSTTAADAYTVKNCGTSVTFDRVPRRVMTYYQQPTELMLALGLRDRIVGTAYPDNEPLPKYRDDYAKLPKVADRDASFEQVLKTTPDLVYGGWDSAFDKTAGRSRKAFSDAGIDTYLNPESCAKGPVRMSDVYTEVKTVGRIFGVSDRADDLVADMRASVERTEEKVGDAERAKVFVYDSGKSAPFTAGGRGVGNQIISLAGGTNIFSDVRDDFADASWEQVVKRKPDVIVIYDYFGSPPVEDKKRFLRSQPELADVPAIEHDRFAVLDLQDTVLGVRAPYAVDELARQIHPVEMS